MSFRVRISIEAETDLNSIIDFILVRESVSRAVLVEERILDVLAQLETMPESGRVVPELQRQGVLAYRELLAAPWRVLYRVVGREVRVVAIIDGRRDMYELLHERLRR